MRDMAITNSDSPHIRVPPPVVYAAGIGVGWLLGTIVPIGRLPLTVSRLLEWTLVAGWFAIGLPAVILSFRKGTTIRPIVPPVAWRFPGRTVALETQCTCR